ncbi:hypothetical protein [Cryptosporangium aurantiacum]|uniref:PGAP1-like protein n=1 Tax=Cryptosporangium aurantiacum TaxID=134849 RepID=A0A1M7RBZ4_9ACTN|nr:hypothetical protein [Cryptosporangium aurantiacum]SHN43659.1 hypothetical protein SAMN05443668_109292 [Cryptosporangium aurantiacum]
MSTGLVFIHGRGQQLSRGLRGDQDRVAAHVAGRKRSWLAGLSKGLVLARRPPIPEKDVWFPFYGNVFADRIDAHVASGGRTPDLESAGSPDAAAAATKERLVLEAAAELGFQPDRELGYGDPEVGAAVRATAGDAQPATEIAWGNVLRLPVARSALQFLARKTGAPEWVIEEFLDDVAYYLEVPAIRRTVLDVVRKAVLDARQVHDDVILVSHSLGTVVAYDLFADLPADVRVRLLVTAGSPLGYPIVQKNLRPAASRGMPHVPRIQPATDVAWVNAYDVRDFVALVHPLGPRFDDGRTAIRDEVTHNASDPHSIADYLSDPDIAGPIGAAASG